MIRLPRLLRWFLPDGTNARTVVICPPAQLPAEVELDRDTRLRGCSRWHEMQNNCAESCKPQIQFSSQDLNDFTSHVAGKVCAECGTELTSGDWYNNRLGTVDRAIEKRSPEVRGPGSRDSSLCSGCFASSSQ